MLGCDNGQVNEWNSGGSADFQKRFASLKVCDWVKQDIRLRISLTAPFSEREAFRKQAKF
jgi:hypothetical protein